jgi:simple sugar transport system permease protein
MRAALNLVPVVFSLAITALLIIAVGENPLAVVDLIVSGSMGSSAGVATSLNFGIPLVLCACGLLVTFRAGLYNIHVEGQMMAGAIAASAAALFVQGLPPALTIGLAVVAGAGGGVFSGVIVGILRTRLGVNEIFGGVAMNALVNLYAIYLISGPWQPPQGGSAQATSPFPRDVRLGPLSPDFPINAVFVVIVIVGVLVTGWLLNGTVWGLHLKATGLNARSALLLGVPVQRSTLTALMLCGALAGLAGAHRVLFDYHSLRPLVSGGIGFLALLVVLLTSVRLAWSVAIALLFAFILAGSTRLKISLQLDPSLTGVLQGLIVLSVLLFKGLRERYFPDHTAEA